MSDFRKTAKPDNSIKARLSRLAQTVKEQGEEILKLRAELESALNWRDVEASRASRFASEACAQNKERDSARALLARAEAARLQAEKDIIHAWTLVDALRDALSFLRVRVLEVYSGPSPMLDEAWEKSRKALAMETYEHD